MTDTERLAIIAGSEKPVVYVAGPMRYRVDFNFPAFDRAKAQLEAKGYTVISPADVDRDHKEVHTADEVDAAYKAGQAPWIQRDVDIIMALRKDRGDGVALLYDWENSAGAKAEAALAAWRGLAVVPPSLWGAPDNEPRSDEFKPSTGNESTDLPFPGQAGTRPKGFSIDHWKNDASGASHEVTGEVIHTDPKTGGQKGMKLERFGLIPPACLAEVARVYGYGAQKYAAGNWLKGYDWGLSIDALHRHINLFERGISYDEESGRHHLAHAAFHLFLLMTFEANSLGTDDRLFANE